MFAHLQHSVVTNRTVDRHNKIKYLRASYGIGKYRYHECHVGTTKLSVSETVVFASNNENYHFNVTYLIHCNKHTIVQSKFHFDIQCYDMVTVVYPNNLSCYVK